MGRHFRGICLHVSRRHELPANSGFTNYQSSYGYSNHSGRIAKGMDANLVGLSSDPAQDATAFSKVRRTIRGGRLIYSAK